MQGLYWRETKKPGGGMPIRGHILLLSNEFELIGKFGLKDRDRYICNQKMRYS